MTEFFKQVEGFGRGRVRVGKIHVGEIKVVHFFPALVFAAYVLLPFIVVLDTRLGLVVGSGLSIYGILIFLDCFRVTGSLTTAFLSVPSAMVQLFGYGYGFVSEMVKR